MRFAVRMAFRELRSSVRRLALFFVAVGIGVAAIVVLRSAADSLQAALTSESRFLMAADVTVSTGEGFTDETEASFDDVASGHPLTGVSRSAQIATLARSADDPLRGAMVELKGVDGAFPLYGDLEVAGAPFGPELLGGRGARASSGRRQGPVNSCWASSRTGASWTRAWSTGGGSRQAGVDGPAGE